MKELSPIEQQDHEELLEAVLSDTHQAFQRAQGIDIDPADLEKPAEYHSVAEDSISLEREAFLYARERASRGYIPAWMLHSDIDHELVEYDVRGE